MLARRRSQLSFLGSIFVLALTTHFTPTTALAQVGADDLEEMLGPIALYADELLANVLTASMYPDEIAAAGKYVAGGGEASKLGEKGWEEAVVAIARIPELIKMMSGDLDWTRAIGEAYVVQPQDVMTAVQILRAKAKQNGTLASNEYQTVTTEGSNIIIQPAQPDVIYVPQYSSQVVYVDSGPSAGDVAVGMAMVFGTALMMDAIFDNSTCCYWGGGGYVGWGHPPYYGGGYHNNDIDIDVNNEINIDNDRVNVDNSRGRDGQRMEPNSKKVDTNALRAGNTKSLNNYKGAGNRAKTGQTGGPKIPSGSVPQRPSTANQNRPGAGGAGQQAQRPSAGTHDAAQRPGAGGAGQQAQRPSAGTHDAAQRPEATHRPDAATNRPQASPASRDASRSSASKAHSGSGASNSSAFRPSSGDAKASSRGHASRSSSGASRGGGGGGGGSRGGGGGGGRGR